MDLEKKVDGTPTGEQHFLARTKPFTSIDINGKETYIESEWFIGIRIGNILKFGNEEDVREYDDKRFLATIQEWYYLP